MAMRQQKSEADQPQDENEGAQNAPQRNAGRDPTASALGGEQHDAHSEQ